MVRFSVLERVDMVARDEFPAREIPRQNFTHLTAQAKGPDGFGARHKENNHGCDQ
jgi:hypothetical protein